MYTATSSGVDSCVARVVLLGASNLRLGLHTLLREALPLFGGRVDICVAHGFGRSYGQPSSIPYRELPSILDCRLWEDLARRPSLPTFALITDVGNDLIYGASPSQLMQWVEKCAARLRTLDANLVVTELPVASILGMTSLRYKFFRTIFFPPSQLTFDTALQLVQETNQGLTKFANEHSYTSINMPNEWYGFDPIHIRRRYRQQAWRQIVQSWFDGELLYKRGVFPGKNRMLIEMALPDQRKFLGISQQRKQPSITLADGSRISIY